MFFVLLRLLCSACFLHVNSARLFQQKSFEYLRKEKNKESGSHEMSMFLCLFRGGAHCRLCLLLVCVLMVARYFIVFVVRCHFSSHNNNVLQVIYWSSWALFFRSSADYDSFSTPRRKNMACVAISHSKMIGYLAYHRSERTSSYIILQIKQSARLLTRALFLSLSLRVFYTFFFVRLLWLGKVFCFMKCLAFCFLFTLCFVFCTRCAVRCELWIEKIPFWKLFSKFLIHIFLGLVVVDAIITQRSTLYISLFSHPAIQLNIKFSYLKNEKNFGACFLHGSKWRRRRRKKRLIFVIENYDKIYQQNVYKLGWCETN